MVYVNGMPVDMTMLEALRAINEEAGKQKKNRKNNRIRRIK